MQVQAALAAREASNCTHGSNTGLSSWEKRRKNITCKMDGVR